MKKLLILLTCLLLGQGLYAQTDRDIKAAEKKEEADRKAAQSNWRKRYDYVGGFTEGLALVSSTVNMAL